MRERAIRLPTLVAFLGFWSVAPLAKSTANDADAAREAIERFGGTVRATPHDKRMLEVEFHLRGRGLTDEGLRQIADLPNIAVLNLKGTRITSRGLVHLRGMTELRRLHLERTRVDDAGIVHLAGLKNLEYLNLYDTEITDRSLDHLLGLPRLRRLYVWQTGVTESGALELEKSLPKLKVVRGIDLSKLPSKPPPESKKPKPTVKLEWVVAGSVVDAPRSTSGINVQVYFENQSKQGIKIYWVSYGGDLKLYGELGPGGTREQNTYSNNTWLITDAKDTPLGYFIVGPQDSLAEIPGEA